MVGLHEGRTEGLDGETLGLAEDGFTVGLKVGFADDGALVVGLEVGFAGVGTDVEGLNVGSEGRREG